jgi:23S rRNA pseudouridine1911/1915/1917 synthase
MADKLRITFAQDDFCRLDKYLIEMKMPELYSRTYIDKLIADDMIKVNGLSIKKSFLLKKSDVIEITLPEPIPQETIPQDIPLDIIFEDDYLAVINKPAGLVVHPGFANKSGTLANAIMHRFGKCFSAETPNCRPGIVHRLDRDTTGLIIVAKSDSIQSILSEMFAQRQVKKTYLTITTGVPNPEQDSIENNINRSLSNPRKMVVADKGRRSVTHYQVLHYYYFFALVKVNLETGRMHQIRVHFANRHFPILGDMLYNTTKNTQSIVPENMKRKVFDLLKLHLQRQALHAWKLEFIHPVSKQLLSLTAPLPEDMIYTLDWLEQHFAIDKVSYKEKLLNI